MTTTILGSLTFSRPPKIYLVGTKIFILYSICQEFIIDNLRLEKDLVISDVLPVAEIALA